jgi:uncharacterized phage protein (TIGR02216 family)
MTGPHPDPLPRAGEGEFANAAQRAWFAAASLLGWRPDDFWNATPAELAGALAPPDDTAPPDRAQIAALMARFPDHED